MFFQARAIMDEVTLKKICFWIAEKSNDLSTAAAHLLQNILVSLTHIEEIRKEKEKYEADRKADVTSKLRPYPFIAEKLGEKFHHFGISLYACNSEKSAY